MTPAAPAARGGPLPLGPWILPLILLAGAAVYVGCLGSQLIWDDLIILRSPVFRDLRHLPELLTQDFRELTGGDLGGPYYRPILALSLALDATLWGVHPGLLRLTNLLLHLLGTALVFGVIEALGAGRLVAALAALAFTFHPAHVEAVVFVSARDNLWLAVAALACLWAHRRAAAQPARGLWVGLALLAHLVATLSKEVALVVPPLLVASDGLCPSPHAPASPAARWRWALRRAMPYVGISFAYFAFRLPAVLEIAGGQLTATDLWGRLPGALESLARYLRLLFVPAFMQPHYPQVRPLSLLAAWPLLGLLLLIGLLVLLALAWRRAPLAALAAAWLLITLAPIVDLVPISSRAMSLADRYLVLPSVGSCLLLAYTVAALIDPPAGTAAASWRTPAGWTSLCVLLAGFPALLLGYLPAWRDNVTLFRRMAEGAPQDPLPLFRLGVAYMDAGDRRQAIAALERSLSLDEGRSARTRAALGLLYTLDGRAGEGNRLFEALRTEAAAPAEYFTFRTKAHAFLGESAQAVAVATEGLQRFPHRAELHEWLGRVLDGSGRPQEAIPHFREALALTPDQFLVEEALGLSLAKTGRPAEAVLHLRQAAEGLPDRVLPRRALAIILEAQGEREASLAWWREVVALAPSGPAAQEAATAVRRLEAAEGAR